jgi:hypothetical protein
LATAFPQPQRCEHDKGVGQGGQHGVHAGVGVEEERLAKTEERQQHRAPEREIATQTNLLGKARTNRDQGG